MYTDTQLKAREKQLMKAFTDSRFQDKLKKVRLNIEDELKYFLKYLTTRLNPEQKIYDNVESRVKGADSFQEKIYRKDYVISWDIRDDKAYNQKLIAENLPDLIGFRITCFFWQDEEEIYRLLQEYVDEKKPENFKFDFSEGTEQANGHKIHKVSGKYTLKEKNGFSVFGFEVQIKGIMHNIWGEVEHKTIYKDKDFDPYTDTKKSITEEIFHALHASNNQLLTLYSRKNDENLLACAMFYEMTKNALWKKLNTQILGCHYKTFFQIFDGQEVTAQIRRYVGSQLLGQTCARLPAAGPYSDVNTVKLAGYIREQFLWYNLNCLYQVANLVFDIPDYDTFVLMLADQALRAEGLIADEQDAFDLLNQSFGDEFGEFDIDEPDEPVLEQTPVAAQKSKDWFDERLNTLNEKLRAWKKNYKQAYQDKKAEKEKEEKQKESQRKNWAGKSEYTDWDGSESAGNAY